MIFSVFDHNARCFDYYEAPGTSANYGSRGTKHRPLTQAPQGALGGVGPIGFAPEALALPLPASARPVGRGEQARGIIAVVPRGSSQLHGFGGEPVLVAPGLSGALGEAEEPRSGVSLGQVIVAACVASVVGVVVQRALK